MKDRPLQNELRESLWRRKPTETERGEWRTQPELSAELELEARLSEALEKIPDSPVPSNFTSRVMQAMELEEVRNARQGRFHWNWRRLLPRAAVAAVAIAFAGFALHRHEVYRQRILLAQNVAQVTQSEPLPSVDMLKNFDAIQRMGQTQHADEKLLALLQ